MAEWIGRGKGRAPGQPSNAFRGGPGAGGGRPGGQPSHKPAESAPEPTRAWSLKDNVS